MHRWDRGRAGTIPDAGSRATRWLNGPHGPRATHYGLRSESAGGPGRGPDLQQLLDAHQGPEDRLVLVMDPGAVPDRPDALVPEGPQLPDRSLGLRLDRLSLAQG